MAEVECVADTGPRLRRYGRQKSAGAIGGRAVGDAFEGVNLVRGHAANFARARGNNGSGRRIGGAEPGFVNQKAGRSESAEGEEGTAVDHVWLLICSVLFLFGVRPEDEAPDFVDVPGPRASHLFFVSCIGWYLPAAAGGPDANRGTGLP